MNNVQVKAAQGMIELCWNLTLLFAVGFCVSMLPDAALASNNALEAVFCNIVSLLTGTTGKAVATVAIIAVGVGALLGKISWGMALIVAVGVALVFGAGTIVSALGASANDCATGTSAISR